MHFKGGEQKPPGLPVNTSSSPTPSPTITQGRSPFFLLPSTRAIIVIPSIPYAHPAPQVKGQPLSTISLKLEPKWSPPPKRRHSSMDAQGDTSMDKDFPVTSQEELPNSKKGKTANWLTSMRPTHMESFSRDSDSVKEARACYFATHSWDWAHSNMEDLSNIFKGLTQEAGLLGKFIFEIQWSWEGPEHLKQANYIFQSQPKGLRFLSVVSTKESLKEMGLKGIHDPEALQHFAGYTYCPWCGKNGQNEGTIVNHLRTVHYKLGLICDQCFGCPTTTADTVCRHGHLV